MISLYALKIIILRPQKMYKRKSVLYIQSTPDKFTPLGPSKLCEIMQSVKLTEVIDKQRV